MPQFGKRERSWSLNWANSVCLCCCCCCCWYCCFVVVVLLLLFICSHADAISRHFVALADRSQKSWLYQSIFLWPMLDLCSLIYFDRPKTCVGAVHSILLAVTISLPLSLSPVLVDLLCYVYFMRSGPRSPLAHWLMWRALIKPFERPVLFDVDQAICCQSTHIYPSLSHTFVSGRQSIDCNRLELSLSFVRSFDRDREPSPIELPLTRYALCCCLSLSLLLTLRCCWSLWGDRAAIRIWAS